MHPKLIELGNFTIFSYGFFLVVAAVLGYFFLSTQARREYNIDSDKISSLLIWIVAASFVGGKVFFYLENPSQYLDHPARLYTDIGNGFVFYGSLIFSIPITIWFVLRNGWPVWGMLDLIGMTIPIIHTVGRLGCLMVGCCHGVPTDSILGITFSDPLCQAEPLNTPLHPTQIYSMVMLLAIFLFLFWKKNRKAFDGQIFLLYVILYSFGRSIIEIFRGDETRGYVIDGILSHSQFISLVLISVVVALYVYRYRVTRKP
ncbi:MAG: prolipoprotein diacylglyceryl transferase [Flavobacteriales bacterium]|jgi:phosphatidylglycerol---prolipoprotein diacylglyceryl transferase|nr:prolipoprotein diacylglyceryl transferase [Flavobacteriales bacterium]MBT3962721.1 prolipoprotein diacylglyceryl transferase [Flavobacteriales bacterium]MBT4704314.1 prolipoprotein diacylglyceryl transferase [Flavobacteriales bacterium]MBT4930530.1 prolipoprotein diacylglyceryl transferase [Flavobacteriales bacterium]MBT5131806.1 prolipoprotein diacylglyceryl transferase [Flavobacteriales bacterium]